MTTKLIKIGNSQGIRLPKALIEQAGLEGPLKLELSGNSVIIRSAKRSPREGWAEAAAELAASGEDKFDEWDCTINDFHGDWTWP